MYWVYLARESQFRSFAVFNHNICSKDFEFSKMIIYQRENFTMSRVCPVYTILVYALVTHLYGMLAEGVKIHDVKFFDGEELVTIYKISLQRCVCECKAKKNRCLSVNYKRAFTSCRLNVNKPNTEEELFDKPGSVYIEMVNVFHPRSLPSTYPTAYLYSVFNQYLSNIMIILLIY